MSDLKIAEIDDDERICPYIRSLIDEKPVKLLGCPSLYFDLSAHKASICSWQEHEDGMARLAREKAEWEQQKKSQMQAFQALQEEQVRLWTWCSMLHILLLFSFCLKSLSLCLYLCDSAVAISSSDTPNIR